MMHVCSVDTFYVIFTRTPPFHKINMNLYNSPYISYATMIPTVQFELWLLPPRDILKVTSIETGTKLCHGII